jgi:hypothetical protein
MAQIDLSSKWVSYEVIDKATEQTPVSTAMAEHGIDSGSIKKMLMVQEVGWPEALKLHFGEQGKHRIVKKEDPIWLLKLTPGCWRLYFYVYEPSKQIVYLHGVCKKKWKEKASDLKKARTAYENIVAKRCAITEFVFPSG